MLEAHKDEYYPNEYARSALKLGLQQESALGANPFRFGMIGATDSHTGFAQVAEDNFFGKYGNAFPSKDRWKHEWPPVKGTVAKMYGWEPQSAGLAAVWATENTREAIWDAMKRKEVYATTGPRMKVRMFGGFDYSRGDAGNWLCQGCPNGRRLEECAARQGANVSFGRFQRSRRRKSTAQISIGFRS
jgi:hypothetical protein